MAMAEGPDFICIGAPKAATGWLYDQLSWHPDIWVSPIKELHVFDTANGLSRSASAKQRKVNAKQLRPVREHGLEKYNEMRSAEHRPPWTGRDLAFLEHYITRKGKRFDFDWYRGLFAAKGASIAGELTPAYCGLSQKMVERIARELPALKIIFLIRDPVARAWSHLQMHKRVMDRRRRELRLEDLEAVRNYLVSPPFRRRARPTATVRRWTQAFPRDQFHYEFFDDVVRSPETVRASIMRFLGVDPALGKDSIPADFNRKSAATKYELTPELQALLVRMFRKEVERCARELGGCALEWQKRYAAA